MPTYQIKTPDGSEYEVTTPDGVTEEQALARFKSEYQAKPVDPYQGLSTQQLKATYQDAKKAGRAGDLPRIADAFVNREAQEAGPVGNAFMAAGDVVRQLARGVPIVGGSLDELNAGTGSLFGGDYDEILDYNRARDRKSDRDAPLTTAALNVGGGVASGLGAARVLGLGVGSSVPLLQRAAAGTGIGSAVGAADFFARGEGGVENRATDAAIGGVIGGGVGAVAPFVGAAINSGARRVMDFLSSDQALQRLGISREAANIIIRQLSADDTLSATGASRIRQAGADGMLVDAGPAARNLLDTALERSGQGSTAAREAIEQRATTAGRQLNAASDRTFGPVQSVEAREDAIRVGTAAARGNAYDAAYNTPIDYNSPGGQEIARLWPRVSPARRAAANRLLEEGGHPPIAEGALPDVRQIDYVTRALNDVAQSGEGQGALGGVNAAGRSAQELSRGLRDATRDAVPEYATALNTAADPIRRIQATRFGATILDKSTTRDDVARELADMTGAERREAITSVRAALDDLAANVKQIASDPNIEARELREQLGALTSRAAREKVGALLGDPRRTNAFFSAMGRSMRALELKASVARNSRTFGRTSTDEQVKAMSEPGVFGNIMEGSPVQAAKRLWQNITQMSPERRLEALDRLYGEIANQLTNVRGRAAERRLVALIRAVNAQAQNARAPQAAGRIGQSAVAGAPAAQANQLLPQNRYATPP